MYIIVIESHVILLMEEILDQLIWQRFYTSQVPGGAGFLPSTVLQSMSFPLELICSMSFEYQQKIWSKPHPLFFGCDSTVSVVGWMVGPGRVTF